MHKFTGSLSVALALLGLSLSSPASAASSWPGDTPTLGGAIAAKVIAQQCTGVLASTDVAELDSYLAKATAEFAKLPVTGNESGQQFTDGLVRKLTETYTSKYQNASACDAASADEARDMLQRVRKVMATGKPVLPDPNDPERVPDVGEAINAKIAGDKCSGTLSVLQQAQVELHIARSYLWLAKTQTEVDARAIIAGYKSAEAAIANGWRSANCSDETRGKAKTTAVLIDRSEQK